MRGGGGLTKLEVRTDSIIRSFRIDFCLGIRCWDVVFAWALGFFEKSKFLPENQPDKLETLSRPSKISQKKPNAWAKSTSGCPLGQKL